MTVDFGQAMQDLKDWWKQHAEREMEKKETLVSRFETAVKRMEQLHTLVNVDKRWTIKVTNKVPAVPWRNDIGASGLMISPQNGTDLANVSISANGVTYTFPAGSTAATVIPLGLPGDVITISGTSATLAVMDLRALGQEETLRFLMRPFGSTVIVGNTVNTLTQLTGSSVTDFVLVNNISIRDTSQHTASTDPTVIFTWSTTNLAGKKVLLIANSHNQALTLGILAGTANTAGARLAIASLTVAAGTSYWIDSASAGASALDDPTLFLAATLQAATAPTSGSLTLTAFKGGQS